MILTVTTHAVTYVHRYYPGPLFNLLLLCIYKLLSYSLHWGGQHIRLCLANVETNWILKYIVTPYNYYDKLVPRCTELNAPQEVEQSCQQGFLSSKDTAWGKC